MSKGKRTTYRHGSVQKEAIEASLALVDKEGSQKLSMRRVASQLGVAHRALYNHFENREALLDAVATEGFNALAKVVNLSETKEQFISAYLNFALDRPHLYGVMMSRPHATMSETPSLQTAVHQVITKSMAYFGDPKQTSEQNRRSVMKATILLHGGLMLRTNGIIDVVDDAHFIGEISKMMAAE